MRLKSLSLGLLAYVSVVEAQPPQSIQEECLRLVAAYSHSLQQFVVNNAQVYWELRDRIVANGGKEAESNFDLEWNRLFQSFLLHGEKLKTSSFVDGEILFEHFLKGVSLWAETPEQLEFAARMLGENREELGGLLFASRMAYLSDRYEEEIELRSGRSPVNRRRAKENPRDSALLALAKFDSNAFFKMGYSARGKWGEEVFRNQLSPGSLEALASLGFRVPLTALPPHALEFNNGAAFDLYLSPIDAWVAHHLQNAHPEEMFLGLGDKSVRQFRRLFRVNDGRIIAYSQAADFLTLVPSSNGASSFVVRELKFSHGKSRKVSIADAVEQLRETWACLYDAYGDEVPVSHLEILFPRRDESLGGDLGADYSMGPRVKSLPIGDEIFPLHLRGLPVSVQVNGKTLPIFVRDFFIQDTTFERLRD